MNAAIPATLPGAPGGERGPFLPFLLLAVAFLGWAAIQTTQLVSDRRSLQAAAAQQVNPLAAAHKIRVAADSLAAKTQALADRGNPDAATVIAKLQERGITINAKAATTPPP